MRGEWNRPAHYTAKRRCQRKGAVDRTARRDLCRRSWSDRHALCNDLIAEQSARVSGVSAAHRGLNLTRGGSARQTAASFPLRRLRH